MRVSKHKIVFPEVVDASVISFASETMFPSNVIARMCDVPYPNGIGIFHL